MICVNRKASLPAAPTPADGRDGAPTRALCLNCPFSSLGLERPAPLKDPARKIANSSSLAYDYYTHSFYVQSSFYTLSRLDHDKRIHTHGRPTQQQGTARSTLGTGTPVGIYRLPTAVGWPDQPKQPH
ncbi:Unknown protein sequence [Pseudomonas amygdali pv. lachrymans]|nr:Unknown protein sequence [Pseudomonas amygdali pv. lachrymans]